MFQRDYGVFFYLPSKGHMSEKLPPVTERRSLRGVGRGRVHGLRYGIRTVDPEYLVTVV